MKTKTMRLTTRQWLMPVEGNGELERAVRMLQRKVLQLDEEVSGDFDHLLDTEEELNQDAPATAAPSVAQASTAKKKEEVRYYYVLRGKYDEEGDAFFRGYVTKAKYQEQQSGTWKFKGNSSHDCEKLTKWIMDNQDAVDQENKTFRNPDGLFSRKWYSIIDRKGAAWIRPTMVNINELQADFPGLSIAQPKVHDSYSAAKAYVIEHGGILDITS